MQIGPESRIHLRPQSTGMATAPLVRFRVFLWHIAIGLITAGAAAYLYQLYLTIP